MILIFNKKMSRTLEVAIDLRREAIIQDIKELYETTKLPEGCEYLAFDFNLLNQLGWKDLILIKKDLTKINKKSKWYLAYKECKCYGCDDCTIYQTAKQYYKENKSYDTFIEWLKDFHGCY